MTQTAINYEKAMYDLSISQEAVVMAGQELSEVPQLLEALENPVLEKQVKHRLIDRVFPGEIKSLLKVICDNGHSGALVEILGDYPRYARDRAGILNASLFFVTPPDERQLQGIRQYLCKQFDSREVFLQMEKDESLIGGFVIRAGNVELDWSLRGRLKQLEQKLMWR